MFHVFSMQFFKFKRLLVETYLCQCYFFVKTILFRAAKASAEPSYIAFLLVFPFFEFFFVFKSRKAIAGAIIDLLLFFFDSVKIFVTAI